MMGKSLNYAYPTTYAEGGSVFTRPATGGSVFTRPATGGSQFTEEQLQQIAEANARQAAAAVSIAEAKAQSAALRAAKPNIDYSEAGQAAALAEAQAFLASHEAQSAAPVMDFPAVEGMDMPPAVAEETYTRPAAYETEYPPMPEASLQDVLGSHAGQDAYREYVNQVRAQVIPPPPKSFYTPPTEQAGIGSFLPKLWEQQQQAGYLMSSTPAKYF
jgi:hypothetical protein